MICRNIIHLAINYSHLPRTFLLLLNPHILLLLGTVKKFVVTYFLTRDKLPSTLAEAYSYALLKKHTSY